MTMRGRVTTAESNSLDLLRLAAAVMVLYSHQYAMLGAAEPSFFGWNTFGGAGVTIFFFLSGMLVWSSWDRDPDWRRYFFRRSLRIFPALWVAVALTALLLGPAVSSLPWQEYFKSLQTWRYFMTAVFINQHNLPGVFAENFYPRVLNGSLWTLPVEFLCYLSVAVVGSLGRALRGLLIAGSLLALVLVASFGVQFAGARFSPHFEMVAVFWWGVWYGYCSQAPGRSARDERAAWSVAALALVLFAMLGERGFERAAMLAFAAGVVHMAHRVSQGHRLTARTGDLSYGMYIFAFPVQQTVVHLGLGKNWSWGFHFGLSLLGTAALAYASWHLVESKALRYKPGAASSRQVAAA